MRGSDRELLLDAVARVAADDLVVLLAVGCDSALLWLRASACRSGSRSADGSRRGAGHGHAVVVANLDVSAT